MPTKRQWVILGALGWVYLIGLGALVGVVTERLRFDDTRIEVVREFHATPPVRATVTPPERTTDLDTLTAPFERQDLAEAERTRRDAYGAALPTRASAAAREGEGRGPGPRDGP